LFYLLTYLNGVNTASECDGQQTDRQTVRRTIVVAYTTLCVASHSKNKHSDKQNGKLIIRMRNVNQRKNKGPLRRS